jgi:hypothetical protein
MQVWEKTKQHFIPSKKNAYRPHLLGRQWLVIFLAITMAVEGFLVADLVAQQSGQVFLASVASASPISQNQTEARSFTQSLQRQYTRLLDYPQPPVDDVLAGLGAFLVVLVALAFFIHIEIQPAAMLAGGALVAVLALSFLYLNHQLLGAGINNLHAEPASATLSL